MGNTGDISEFELTTGADAFIQPLAEDVNSRASGCSSEILAPKYSQS